MDQTKDIYAGGRWTPAVSAGTIAVHSPSTEALITEVPDASLEDIDTAVAAARTAIDSGPWSKFLPARRADVMDALLAELNSRADELAHVISTENGTPKMVSRRGQVDNGLDVLRYYAGLARCFEPESRVDGMYSPAVIRREPVGTVAAVVPWNVPFFLSMLKVAPAMAAGAAVVLKSAPETPLCGYLLAEAADAAGVPPGVLNVLTAAPEASEYLVTHSGIDKVAFTGSTSVGRRIASLAASQLKRLTLELGGKSAAIVLDDIDIREAMGQLIPLTMTFSGQFCTAQSRILVPRSRYDEAVEIFAALVAALPIGEALQDGATSGR
jgi:aldehyde dehydrogenase (NAD+)